VNTRVLQAPEVQVALSAKRQVGLHSRIAIVCSSYFKSSRKTNLNRKTLISSRGKEDRQQCQGQARGSVQELRKRVRSDRFEWKTNVLLLALCIYSKKYHDIAQLSWQRGDPY
jgi:hypothetical protein